MNEEQKKRFFGYLLWAGATNLKISRQQEMKLKEWIIPYACEEFGFSTQPLEMGEMQKYIDAWERADLNPENYKYYYVEKN